MIGRFCCVYVVVFIVVYCLFAVCLLWCLLFDVVVFGGDLIEFYL